MVSLVPGRNHLADEVEDAPPSPNRASRSSRLRIPSALRSLFSSRSGRSSSLNAPLPLPPPSPPSRPSALRSTLAQGNSGDGWPAPQPLTAAHSRISPRLGPPLDPLDTLSSSWFATTRPSGPNSDGMIYPSTSPWYVPGDPVELGQTAYHSHSPFIPPGWAGVSPEPQTNIHGGTFISGNVTQIQQGGEQGGCCCSTPQTVRLE
jgi:hypothetical protein